MLCPQQQQDFYSWAKVTQVTDPGTIKRYSKIMAECVRIIERSDKFSSQLNKPYARGKLQILHDLMTWHSAIVFGRGVSYARIRGQAMRPEAATVYWSDVLALSYAFATISPSKPDPLEIFDWIRDGKTWAETYADILAEISAAMMSPPANHCSG